MRDHCDGCVSWGWARGRFEAPAGTNEVEKGRKGFWGVKVRWVCSAEMQRAVLGGRRGKGVVVPRPYILKFISF